MIFHSANPTVEFEICGDNYCKLLNRLKASGILVQNVKIKDECITFVVDFDDFDKTEKIIKQCGCICRKTENKGIYLKLKGIRNLKSYVLGLVICAIILRLVSLFLWNIEFEGNFSITDEQLNSYLLKNNIYTGVFLKNVDCNALESGIRNEYFDVTWVCAEIKGTNLIIHIKENYNKEISMEEKKPYDLVAKHNSVIDSIVTRSGTPLVKKGDIVKEGDILISGTVDVFNESEEKLFTNYVNADGDIYGETTFVYEDSFPLNHIIKVIDKNAKTSGYVEIFGNTIGGSIKGENKKIIIDEYKTLKIFKNFYLPVKFGMKKQYSYENSNKKYTKKEAKQLAEHNLELFLKSLEEKEMQILKKDVNIDVGNNQCIAKGTVTVIEPLAKVSPIIYQEEGTLGIDERN